MIMIFDYLCATYTLSNIIKLQHLPSFLQISRNICVQRSFLARPNVITVILREIEINTTDTTCPSHILTIQVKKSCIRNLFLLFLVSNEK